MSTTGSGRPRLLWHIDLDDDRLAAAFRSLRADLGGDLGDVGGTAGPDQRRDDADVRPDAVLVVTDRPSRPALVGQLLGVGAPLLLLGPTLHADTDGVWHEHTGLLTATASPQHDVRVRAGHDAGPLADRLSDHSHGSGAHLGEHVHVSDRVLVVDKVADDVRVLLTASLGLAVHPVLARRGDVLAWTLGTTPASVSAPTSRRLLALLLADLPRTAVVRPVVRAGLLGYGAIGHEHAAAFRAVSGLSLELVCDRNGSRVDAAQAVSPGLRGTTDPESLIEDPDVDLVVVSTPPDTHAEWALRALRAGKHVVVEKPFAIRTEEADAVLAEADAAGLLAVVYQNRRWDPDHQAVRRAVLAGRLGEVFHLETFVGGYGHPCNLWHSDAGASGGAFYDWGAHVLDQVLDLVPAPVQHVSATTHKRRWFDVTNADHSRVLLRFDDGAEAEFVHSDLAAALKPRWYVLGTEAAIVGSWRTERVIARNEVGTLSEDVLAPADSPPVLELFDGDGSVTRLATPASAPHPFHRELADHLLLGLPMSVTGATSRRVLSVMEAATASALDGGRPVVPR
ncbi:Gfo/Idh/MocA family protein [Aquipuribacter sp. MA13-6]|uniref:Gfo/Idh/MocA family protein n=1 Tax=unclassified Aquipuribacter TaxID=2635084 RepID=UPI003EE98E6B